MNDYQAAVAEIQEEIDIMQFIIQMRIKLAHIELLSDCLQESAEKEQLPPGWVASFFDFIIIAACTSRYRGVVAERDMLGIALNTLQFGISPQRAF